MLLSSVMLLFAKFVERFSRLLPMRREGDPAITRNSSSSQFGLIFELGGKLTTE